MSQYDGLVVPKKEERNEPQEIHLTAEDVYAIINNSSDYEIMSL